MSPKDPRLSLESDADDAKLQQMRRGGLKLNAGKSQFVKNTVKREEFEQQADLVFDQIQDRKQLAAELVREFWSFVMDETLIEEKGPLKKELEKEIVKKLLWFASEMNNDPNDSEGAGSIAILSLLLKAVMYLRDINSTLSYRLSEVEKQIKKMSSQAPTSTKVK